MAIENKFSSAAAQSPGSKNKIYIAGNYYGRNWNEQDQAHYDLYLKSLEMDQNLAILEDERKYNSPQNQASLMRAAGLNPDFQNINFDASSAQNVAAPTAPAAESRSTRISNYANVAKSFLDLLPQAINMYSQMRSTSLDLQSKLLNNEKTIQSIADDDLFNIFTAEDWEDMNKDDISPQRSEELNKKLQTLNNRASHFKSLNRRIGRSYSMNLANLMNMDKSLLKGRSYGRQSSAANNRSNFLKLIGQYGMNLDDDTFVDIIRDFNAIVFEGDKQDATNRKIKVESKPGLRLMEKGQQRLDKGENIIGAIEYLLGLLIESNISFSRASGPKGVSTTVGF